MNKHQSHQRIIYTAAAVVIIAMLALVWLLNRSFVTFKISPPDAVVTIDNAPVSLDASGSGKLTLSPGIHTLSILADNYIGVTKEIKLKRAGSAEFDVDLLRAPEATKLTDAGFSIDNFQSVIDAGDFNSIFYLGNNGSAFYLAKFTTGSDGSLQVVSNQRISNPALTGIRSVVWSPKNEAALLRKDDGIYFFDFKKYNFVSQELVKYGDNIGDIVWSPDNSKIVYYFAPGTGEKSIITADKANGNQDRIINCADLGIDNPVLAISPDSEFLLVTPRNQDINSNKIYLFDLYTKTMTTVNDGGLNMGAVFSPDGSNVLYSSYSKDQNSSVYSLLSIMSRDGSNKKSTDLRAFINRTIWLKGSQSQLIAASYDPAKKTEAIFGYDIENKTETGVHYNLPSGQSVTALTLTQNNNLLFYIANGQLYGMKLTN